MKIGDPNEEKSAMIVIHGLLGSKLNWRGICQQTDISSRRDCYLVELRNHATSEHHTEMNYNALSEDIIRFADENGIKKFTILGHSMGGKTAMTLACKYPDRVDGVISVDSAPVDESGPQALNWLPYKVLKLMYSMSQEGITRSKAIEKAKEFFNNNPEMVGMLEKNMSKNKEDKLEWLVNIDSLFENFQQVPYFDESLLYENKTVYHLVGENSQLYKMDQY